MTEGLFTPLTLRGTTFKNRIWIAPMCQYSAVDGVIGKWHTMHLGSFASGGTGLILTEATAVVPEGRISVVDAGLWNDACEEAWSDVIAFVHELGAHIGVQLQHAGRKGSRRGDWVPGHAEPAEGGWQTLGPSANAFEDYPAAREMTRDEVLAVPGQFAAAAVRAVRADFDVIELHAAHGYLLHQFLSPITNERTDDYGGTFENRVRLLLETVVAVRAVMPTEMPLFVRISATDWIEGGWDLEQSVKLAHLLKAEGVDLIDVSTAGLSLRQQVAVGPHYQVPFAAAIRERAGIPTSAVGLITDPQKANDIIASGEADAVCIGRPALRNPRWPYFAAEALGIRIPLPEQLYRSRTIH